MKITVNTTSTSIKDLLWPTKYEELIDDNVSSYRESRLTIRNNWSTIIFLENKEDATISDGFPLLPDEGLEVEILKVDRLNMISETTDNTDIRLFNS